MFMEKKVIYYTFMIAVFLSYSCERSVIDCHSLDKENEMWYEIKRRKRVPFTGKCITEFSSGIIESSSFYKNGSLDGETIFYYKNGDVKEILTYSKGRLNGEVVYFYKNKNKELTGNLVNGLKSGTWKYYYENGNTEEVLTYDNDKLNGLFLSYFKDGKIKMEGHYLEGARDDEWFFYDSLNGDVMSRITYLKDSVIEKKVYN